MQLQPPAQVPSGLRSGYGVDKVRDTAYHKALVDLIVRASEHPSEPAFQRHAAEFIAPSFINEGVKSGLAWVLVGSNESELSRGWDGFVEWQRSRLEEARQLYAVARSEDRVAALRAAILILDDAGETDDQLRIAEETEKQFRTLLDSGYIAAAEESLDGADPVLADACRSEALERRKQALTEMLDGDDAFRSGNYKGAIERYRIAGRLDRDNPQLSGKIAMAEDQNREGRLGTVRFATSAIGWGARLASEYFNSKHEKEERKREEALREERRRKRDDMRKKIPAAPSC